MSWRQGDTPPQGFPVVRGNTPPQGYQLPPQPPPPGPWKLCPNCSAQAQTLSVICPYCGASYARAAPYAAPRPFAAVDPVGIAIALLGAVAVFVSVFLPLVEATTTFGGVSQNTLIQNGDGWLLVGLALGIVGSTYTAARKGQSSGWAVVILGGIAVAVAVPTAPAATR